VVSGETCTVLVHAHDGRVDHLDDGIIGDSERVKVLPLLLIPIA